MCDGASTENGIGVSPDIAELRSFYDALDQRCTRLEASNAQLLDLLIGFSAGVLRVRSSLLANSTAES